MPAHAPIDLNDGDVRILPGDAREVLSSLPDDSIDAIVTDPPYGLSREPDISEVLTHWLAGDDYIHTGAGFMGQGWDSFVPGPNVWREALRVLKPGGHALVFSSTRTVDLTTIALRLAGFEIRDQLTWTYGAGWPKSLDVAKAFDKTGDHDRAKQYDGYGTALKPAQEPIVLVRKPLIGTVIENITVHGTGGLNIDASRIKNTTSDGTRDGEESAQRRYTDTGGTNFAGTPGQRGGATEGRFPPNVLFTHAATCEQTGTRQVGDHPPIPVYDCAPGCPVAELDKQSGIRTSGKPGTYRGNENTSAAYGTHSGDKRAAGVDMPGYGDTGGASRFYPTFKYASKASPDERATVWIPDAPCVGAGHSPDPHDPDTVWHAAASPTPHACNTCGAAWIEYQHATVKPLSGGVLQWLIRLITVEGGTVLDLYSGTGTTGVAATQEGFKSILIERDPVHVAMTRKRLTEPIQTTLFGVA